MNPMRLARNPMQSTLLTLAGSACLITMLLDLIVV